jgi:hypothetical protein
MREVTNYVRGRSYVCAAISHDLRDAIELEADKQDVTLSAVVRNILEQHFGLDKK